MYIEGKVPLFSTGLVSFTATSSGTPYTSTLTSGSTIEDFFLFTLGSCCADMTWWQMVDTSCLIRKTNILHIMDSFLKNRTLHQLLWINASVCFCVCIDDRHHDMERLVLQPVSSGQSVGVKPCGSVPHVGWFQDVATFTVHQESALVHIHVRARRLEVQSHWREMIQLSEGCMRLIDQDFPLMAAILSERTVTGIVWGLYQFDSRRSTGAQGCSWMSWSWSLLGRFGSACPHYEGCRHLL